MFNGRLRKLGSGQHRRSHRLRRSGFYPHVAWISYVQSKKKTISTTNMTRAQSFATGRCTAMTWRRFTRPIEGDGTFLQAHLSHFCHVGGTLPLRSLQLRLQVLLFSSQLQSAAGFGRCRHETWVNMTSLNKNTAWNKLDRVKGMHTDIFQLSSIT